MPECRFVKKRSDCPVSNVLDLLGDKWTLIVLRDMLFFEKKLYKELSDSNEGIPTNILADRLKRLESAEILTKESYQNNPPRYAYRLTSKGLDLFPVLKEIIVWGIKHLPGLPRRDPAFLKEVEKRILRQKAASTK
ncbi:MAG: helix-turn-helix domain-containing protein [bacterium]